MSAFFERREFLEHKFDRIREISSMLDKAPPLVIEAYQAGATDIVLLPGGITVDDCCEASPPGWYARYHTSGVIGAVDIGTVRCTITTFRFICTPDGSRDPRLQLYRVHRLGKC